MLCGAEVAVIWWYSLKHEKEVNFVSTCWVGATIVVIGVTISWKEEKNKSF